MIKNQIKTVLLLGALTGLLLWIGSFFGRAGLFTGLVFALIMNFGSYFFSDKIVLFMYRAKEIKEKDNPELYKIVREVAKDAKLPMPKVCIVPSEQANAFATGRDPKHAAVAVTQGIMYTLSKNELKGVIAHEMAHIKNRDTLIQTIAATIAGVISYLAMLARFGALFGGGNNRDRSSLFELIALAILTPLIATIIQLAISRSREYMADEKSAKITREPLYLASALEKLELSAKKNPLRFGSKATSSLFITNPFKGQAFFTLFSTHPSTAERIKRLKAMVV